MQGNVYPWIKFISPLVAACALFTILLFSHIYGFGIALFVWFFFLGFLHYHFHVSPNQTALSAMTAMSFVILLVLVESILLRWFFVGFSIPIFFFIVYWSEPRFEQAVHIKEKPLRRILMMLYVFNVYALFLGLYAIYLFFSDIQFWVLSIVGGLYAALGSYMIWNLYVKIALKDSVVWTAIVMIAMIELMWVMHLLPFGYLALGLITVWVWYVLQLFIRFHLSSKGILWKEQRGFIIGNIFLYILVLYLIRWI